MSDYVHKKVLRFPVDGEYFGVDSLYDLASKMESVGKAHLFYGGAPHFEPAPTEDSFLDYVLSEDYGKCDGEYGKIRKLTKAEQEKYRPVFELLIPDIDMDSVHLVEFCWYNCSEAPSYYDETTYHDSFCDEV